MTNPLFDNSPWTLAGICGCTECRRQRRSWNDFAEFFNDVSLSIIYRRWPEIPDPPRPNLPARRKWIVRRHRIVVRGETTYLPGWQLISPSGHLQWCSSRAEIAYYAHAARSAEIMRIAMQAVESIGMGLLS
ncbi:hypothetical protein OS122_02625 [Mycolicibacterium mucogenicum]|uniref:hypothetical protein n=1 Tax=Mycolicibacterium mucogenicum TaxID=56689 RepID=UPI00226AA01B|nr:hypothetical protein [Mycolicibacterium mucogenicum]MCX8559794.1 hypothetical protein [Mycolicibacterium mucogenicum]